VPERQGLLLGYAAVPEPEIDRAARRLARALETLL
jgi:DNA-binding transcriptional MocR family regulator